MPQNADEEHRHLFTPFEYRAQKVRILDLNDAIVTRSGTCLQGWRLVPESVPPYPHLQRRFHLLAVASRLRRRLVNITDERPLLLVHNSWSAGYFHWMTESLVKLWGIRERGAFSPLLVPPYPGLREVVLTTSKLLGFHDLVDYPAGTNLRVGHLLLAENSSKKAHFDPAALLGVRDALIRAVDAPTKPLTKLYISRASASRRRVVNEVQVQDLLRHRGFEVVHAEKLHIKQQVELFSRARTVVSIHGAGLSNAMFMPKGASLLELYKTPERSDRLAPVSRTYGPSASYRRLAAALDLNYLIQFCAPAEANTPVDRADLIVHLETLSENLKILEANELQ